MSQEVKAQGFALIACSRLQSITSGPTSSFFSPSPYSGSLVFSLHFKKFYNSLGFGLFLKSRELRILEKSYLTRHKVASLKGVHFNYGGRLCQDCSDWESGDVIVTAQESLEMCWDEGVHSLLQGMVYRMSSGILSPLEKSVLCREQSLYLRSSQPFSFCLPLLSSPPCLLLGNLE